MQAIQCTSLSKDALLQHTFSCSLRQPSARAQPLVSGRAVARAWQLTKQQYGDFAIFCGDLQFATLL